MAASKDNAGPSEVLTAAGGVTGEAWIGQILPNVEDRVPDSIDHASRAGGDAVSSGEWYCILSPSAPELLCPQSSQASPRPRCGQTRVRLAQVRRLSRAPGERFLRFQSSPLALRVAPARVPEAAPRLESGDARPRRAACKRLGRAFYFIPCPVHLVFLAAAARVVIPVAEPEPQPPFHATPRLLFGMTATLPHSCQARPWHPVPVSRSQGPPPQATGDDLIDDESLKHR